MTQDTPHSLLERLRLERNETDWRRLFDLYAPLVRHWLAPYAIASADVDDLLQEVFKTLVSEITTFEHNGRPGAFRRWLRQTLIHRLRGHWRQQRTARVIDSADGQQLLRDLEDPTNDLSDQWDREHDRFVARRLLELIEPEFTATTWYAFRRQVLDGAKAAEVALELGSTSNAVLIAKSRVLRRFREEIQGLVD